MKIFYPVAKPFIDSKDIEGVVKVLKSGNLSLGLEHIRFEQAFAKTIKTKYAVSVANGTCGLHLAVKAMDLKDGDEVITTPFSFVASSNCLLYENVKPVFVDIEEETFNIDSKKIERAITKKTKGILVVHIFGQSAQMDEIIRIADKYKLKIIEDSCESLGAAFKGKSTGTMGNIGVFAFYPNKQMTTGEGGMIVTDNHDIYNLCKSLRNQGRMVNDKWLKHNYLGYNYRLTEMQAILGISQLKKLNWMIDQKRKIVELYNQHLSNTEGVILPKIGNNRTHSWFVYVIRIKKNRNIVIEKLIKEGIQTRPYMPTIHLQPFMKKRFSFQNGDFPIAEKVSSQTLALPLYIGLGKKDIIYITQNIKKAIYG